MRSLSATLAAAACVAFVAGASASAAEKPHLGDVIVQCAACHGADGIAKSADVPHLAGQQEPYLLNQIKAFRSGKRPHREMRYMSRQLTGAEMAEIAQHYARMPR
jgi:cytochrome c553